MITPDIEKKLFLVDAYALIFRAYFAFAKIPRVNSKGQNTSAAFGFTNALIDVIKNERPTHLGVVFDPPGGSTIRREEFEQYKAHREETPEGITTMIEPIKQIIRAFNIPLLELPGYEADDVIGALSKHAEQRGFTTYMMTPDKDFGQLVTEKVFMYRPGRGGGPAEVWGIKEVCEKFDIERVDQVIDLLGLQGDTADNIPGIPGVGPKTASKLLKDFGSLEGILENTDQLKGKLRENLEQFADQGRMSKSLATIITDIELPFDEEDLAICPPNNEMIKEVFTELEFRALARRVIGEDIVVSSPVDANGQLDLFGTQSLVEEQAPVPTSEFKTIATEKASYHLVTQPEERRELLDKLLTQEEVCFDTETTGLDSLHADLVGMAFSFEARTGFYVAIPKNFEDAKKVVSEFLPFFNKENQTKIAHNMKYDLQVLSRYGISVKGNLFDTMIAHYLINPEGKQSMDALAELYLNYQPVSIESLIGKKGKNQGNMGDLAPEQITDYACEDADITFQLKQLFAPEIEKPHLKSLFYDMEMPLMSVLSEMEQEGIAIDTPSLEKYSVDLAEQLTKLEHKIKALAGTDFNIDSPKQLGDVLFDYLKITTKAKKTKTGQYATSEDVLDKLRDKHPIVNEILEYRQLRKLKSTYVDPLPTMCDSVDGRIHTSFMQTVTSTGRLSSNNPNLQNIPIRTANGREIRKAFIPRDANHVLLAADYSQIELRIIAALSSDENMITAFKKGHDIHAATASKVYHVPIEAVTREQRSAAKAVNFGIIYGQSAFGLAQNLNISRTEAKEIIDAYFAQYGSIKSYMDNAIAKARELGYVETIFKRRRYLPDIQSANAVVRGFAERNAINAPIQGSAADVIKLAMVAVKKAMNQQGVKSKLLLQVHDELVFDVPHDEVELMKKLVKETMESAVDLVVPMVAEVEIGNNWLEAH